MNRIVKHRPEEGKPLYDYNSVSSYSDCPDRIVCFSERDFNIILNALSTVEKAQTRVYVSRPGHNLYEIASSEQFGTFTTYITGIYERMGDYMACNEYLERIAIALETMQQAQDEQVVNLADVFEALGLEPSESEADILEALDYLLNFPGMPAIPKLPLGQWLSSYFEGRYRSAHLQLLRDIAISERGQAVAQGGIDFAALYDTMGETADSLLVKAGYAGKAYWLWRWIDNDQIPGWAGWITTISGLLLGSIRNAAYDIAEALGLLELSPTVNNSITNNVECSNCGSTGSCGCGGFVSGNQPISEVLDAPVTTEPDREYDPPPTGNESWTEYDTIKCAWLNKILDDYISTLQNIGSLFGFIGVLTAAVFAAMLTIAVPPVGIAVVFAAIAGLVAIDIGLLANFNAIATEIDNRREAILCDLMDATSTDEMIGVFYNYLTSIIPEIQAISVSTQGFYLNSCHGLQSNLLWTPSIENGGVQPEGYEGAECNCEEVGLVAIQVQPCTVGHPMGEIVSGDLTSGTVRLTSLFNEWPHCGGGQTVQRLGIGRLDPEQFFDFSWTIHDSAGNRTIQYHDLEGTLITTDTSTESGPVTGRNILFQSIGTGFSDGLFDMTIDYDLVP